MTFLARWAQLGALVLLLSLAAAPLEAQSPAWIPTAEPAPEPATHHEVWDTMVFSALAVWGTGYLASIAWGSYYLGNLPLASLRCNDLYGGFHFLPVLGPVIGMLTGGDCVPDTLHLEEAVMPVLVTLPQVLGTVLLAIGLAGHDVRDVPQVALHVDGTGGELRIGGTF